MSTGCKIITQRSANEYAQENVAHNAAEHFDLCRISNAFQSNWQWRAHFTSWDKYVDAEATN